MRRIDAGLAPGIKANSPVTLVAANETLYLQAKQAGSATEYTYNSRLPAMTLQTSVRLPSPTRRAARN
jgi:hypothetical protein